MPFRLAVFLCIVLFCCAACAIVEPIAHTLVVEPVAPGVRKVFPADSDRSAPAQFQRFDAETGQWFEAEQDAAGQWVWTQEGEASRDQAREHLAERKAEAPITPAHMGIAGEDVTLKARTGGSGAPQAPAIPLAPPAPTPEPAPLAYTPQPAQPTAASERPSPDDEPAPTSIAPSSQLSQAPPVNVAPSTAPTTEDAAGAISPGANPDSPAAEDQGPRGSGTIHITARSGTWVSTIVDGGDRKDSYLSAGQALSLSYNQYSLVTIGDTEAVSLTHNGQEFPLFLRSGKEIRFPPE